MNSKVTAIAAAALTLLASVPVAISAEGEGVPVYDSTQIAFSSYVVVKRIWVQDWKTVFWVGGHADEAGARQAVIDEAARVGADAVVNLKCFGETDHMFKPAGHYCYGNAIRLRNEIRVR